MSKVTVGGRSKLELLVPNEWRQKYWEKDPDGKVKSGKLVAIEVPIDSPLHRQLIHAYEHPDESSSKWCPELQTDPNKPPQVGDTIWVGSSWYIDHDDADVEGGMAVVSHVKYEPLVNGGDWCITTIEHGNHGYYWRDLANHQKEHFKSFGKHRASKAEE